MGLPPVPRAEHLELGHREARELLLPLLRSEGLAHAARGRHLVRVRARVRARARARARSRVRVRARARARASPPPVRRAGARAGTLARVTVG